jgi:hypothetical protein
MSFAVMSAISFGGTGWLALALLASEMSSPLQLASSAPAPARAADVTSARTSEAVNQRLSSTPTGHFRTPNHSEYALKPLHKIVPFDLPRRNPNAMRQPLLRQGMVNRV